MRIMMTDNTHIDEGTRVKFINFIVPQPMVKFGVCKAFYLATTTTKQTAKMSIENAIPVKIGYIQTS